MKRDQTLHETLIPMLVEGVGAENYLEFGTHMNETIGKVRCARRTGVDMVPALPPGMTYGVTTDGLTLFRMTTAEFIKDHAASLAPYDFVFIDADHNAQSAGFDFFGILPYVQHEGLICLHDTNPETVADTAMGLCGDSWRLARSLQSRGYESVTLPYHPGLTIVRKRWTWGPKA